MHELFTGLYPESSKGHLQHLPSALSRAIEACLQHSPEQRPSSIEEVKRQLLLVLQGKHLHPKRWEKEKHQDAIPKDYKLLDVLKENRYGATYLVNEPRYQQLLVVKKQGLNFGGDAFTINQQLSGVAHPHIATIHGVAKNKRVFITVVEYVPGGSLQERLSQAFSLEHWLLLACQLCDGLAFIHKQGLFHGNLRPSNVLLVGPGHVKLTDFGFRPHDDESTDWYQPIGEMPSKVGDIFSAGALLFHLLTGEPVKQENKRIKNAEALDNLPAPLKKVLLNMLQISPVERYQSIDAVKRKLAAFTDEKETLILQSERGVHAERILKKSFGWRNAIGALILVVLLLFLGLEMLWLLEGGSPEWLLRPFGDLLD